MGDMSDDGEGGKLSDFLPKKSIDPSKPIDKTLHDLLAFGRASASSFDLKNSPLSLYLYLDLGTDGFHARLDSAKSMFDGKKTYEAFLSELPPALLTDVAGGCGEMAFTRKTALAEIIRGGG